MSVAVAASEERRLPQGWTWTTLGDLCHPPQYGYTTKAAPSGMTRFLRTTDITKESVNWAKVPFCADEPDDVEKYKLAPGDIVISRAGSVGFSAMIEEGPDAVFASYLIRFRPIDPATTRYLKWFLQSPDYWHSIGAEAVGIALANVNAKKLAAISVPLPPLGEQERIVKTVETLMSQIAAAAENLHRTLGTIADLRRSVLAPPFAGYYPRVRVSEVGDVVLGFTPSRKSPELWDGGIPWVSSGEVAFHQIDATRETIAPSALGRRDLNPPGTVLVAMYGEGKTRGQAAILGIEAVTNQAVAAIRLDPDKMLPEFLYQCLMHEYSAIRAVAQGGQQPNLNGEMVRSIEIPLPSITDQRAFVEAAERQMAGVDQMESSLHRSLANAGVLRAAILRDAMAGKLTQSRTYD